MRFSVFHFSLIRIEDPLISLLVGLGVLGLWIFLKVRPRKIRKETPQ